MPSSQLPVPSKFSVFSQSVRKAGRRHRRLRKSTNLFMTSSLGCRGVRTQTFDPAVSPSVSVSLSVSFSPVASCQFGVIYVYFASSQDIHTLFVFGGAFEEPPSAPGKLRPLWGSALIGLLVHKFPANEFPLPLP